MIASAAIQQPEALQQADYQPAEPPLKKQRGKDVGKAGAGSAVEECSAHSCKVSLPTELFELQEIQQILNMDT